MKGSMVVFFVYTFLDPLNLCGTVVPGIHGHPPPDTPQRGGQKAHLRDPQINQVEGIDIPKQEVAKSSQSRFFNEINSKTL